MTKHHKIVSLQLPEELVQHLTTEAQDAPFVGNLSAYLRSLIESRHQKTVVASPQAQALIDRYEQQLVQLAQTHQDEFQEFSQLFEERLDRRQRWLDERDEQIVTLRQNLLDYQQAYEQLLEEQGALLSENRSQQWQHEEDVKQLAKRKEEVERLTGQLEEAKEQVEQLQEQAYTTSHWFNQANTLLTNYPDVTQRVANGLGHLFGIRNEPQPQGPSDPAIAIAIELGQGLIKLFPDPQLKVITDVLNYLYDFPSVKDQLVTEPKFIAYQTKRREQWARRKRKPS